MQESESVRILADPESVEAVAARVLAESGDEPPGEDGASPAPAAPRRGPYRPRGRKTKRTRSRPPAAAKRPAPPSDLDHPAKPVPEPGLTPAQKAEQLQQSAAVLAPLIHSAVAVLVNRRWPDQPYTMEEAHAFTLALLPVLEKRAGGVLARYGEETRLGLVVFAQGNARKKLAVFSAAPDDRGDQTPEELQQSMPGDVLAQAGYQTVDLARMP